MKSPPARSGRCRKDWNSMRNEANELRPDTLAPAEPAHVPAESAPVPTGPSRGQRLRGSFQKLLRGKGRKAVALLLVVAIAGGVVIWRGRGQTAAAVTEYQEASVERRSITNSPCAAAVPMPDGAGSLRPFDKEPDALRGHQALSALQKRGTPRAD